MNMRVMWIPLVTSATTATVSGIPTEIYLLNSPGVLTTKNIHILTTSGSIIDNEGNLKDSYDIRPSPCPGSADYACVNSSDGNILSNGMQDPIDVNRSYGILFYLYLT